eukprot:CAMPEP_0170174568 /NCGR_PEP_ID=MMETSP0040_2-20121228/7788_1 /TAXON_ID=641309 /ORGANISM="Lotharella oceanica, Strain CCMP622" /LENGTH=142 /DNA_ID=CAMNT_0010416261 /DNA_START=516 /DNA_END=944 /DNA_ORIENTATION=-
MASLSLEGSPQNKPPGLSRASYGFDAWKAKDSPSGLPNDPTGVPRLVNGGVPIKAYECGCSLLLSLERLRPGIRTPWFPREGLGFAAPPRGLNGEMFNWIGVPSSSLKLSPTNDLDRRREIVVGIEDLSGSPGMPVSIGDSP